VQLVERKIGDAEVGCSLDELASGGRGLRIYRGDRAIGFWEADAKCLEAGDTVVEIVPTTASDGPLRNGIRPAPRKPPPSPDRQ
jgi:voltage-gated potassium channel